MFGFGSGDTNALTMNKAHPDSLLDTSAQDIIGKPIDRIDGPKKVSGQATYAAEYALDNVAYGFLVRATVGAGGNQMFFNDAGAQSHRGLGHFPACCVVGQADRNMQGVR